MPRTNDETRRLLLVKFLSKIIYLFLELFACVFEYMDLYFVTGPCWLVFSPNFIDEVLFYGFQSSSALLFYLLG